MILLDIRKVLDVSSRCNASKHEDQNHNLILPSQ